MFGSLDDKNLQSTGTDPTSNYSFWTLWSLGIVHFIAIFQSVLKTKNIRILKICMLHDHDPSFGMKQIIVSND